MYGRICFAPSAQLMPTLSRSMWETEIQKASTECPERVLPLCSLLVTVEGVVQGRNSICVERVGLDDVGASFEVLTLNGLHDGGLRDVQDVEVPAQVARVLQKLRTAKSLFLKALRLDHGAHGAVQNDDPLL